MTEPTKGDALIIVDVQQDFLPGGALAVSLGDEVIPVLNGYLEKFEHHRLPVFATRDWHPANHCSFRAQGGPWPPHCVAGTPGAAFAGALVLPRGTEIVSKGVLQQAPGYSAFEITGLAWRLHRLACKRVYIGGLATDYCVQATAADALREGLEVVILEEGIRPVDVEPGDGARALESLVAQGAKLHSGLAQ